MAEVVAGRNCPKDGTLLAYAGNRADEALTASCFVCGGNYAMPNHEYQPKQFVEAHTANPDGTVGHIKVTGDNLVGSFIGVHSVPPPCNDFDDSEVEEASGERIT